MELVQVAVALFYRLSKGWRSLGELTNRISLSRWKGEQPDCVPDSSSGDLLLHRHGIAERRQRPRSSGSCSRSRSPAPVWVRELRRLGVGLID